MSATNQGPAATPVLIVDALELAEYIRHYLADPERNNASYTDIFSANKTDLAATPGGAVAASRLVLNTDVHAIVGWSVAETSGTTPAAIRLIDGATNTGEVFTRINLLASESVRDWYIPKGVRCSTGRMFLQVISGSVEGVVYWL
jgi:hypothetical protein